MPLSPYSRVAPACHHEFHLNFVRNAINILLADDSEVRISTANSLTTLQKSKVTRKDSGNYHLVATNKKGAANGQLQVDVLGMSTRA